MKNKFENKRPYLKIVFSNVRKKGWACIFLMKTSGLSYRKNDPQEMKKHHGNKHWLKC